MTLQERMKKYAEYCPAEEQEWRAVDEHPQILQDLQATVRALEVARDDMVKIYHSLKPNPSTLSGFHMEDRLKTINEVVVCSINNINQTLGKANI